VTIKRGSQRQSQLYIQKKLIQPETTIKSSEHHYKDTQKKEILTKKNQYLAMLTTSTN